MKKTKLASSAKSTTDNETTTLLVVGTTKLGPLASKKAVARHASNETKEALSGAVKSTPKLSLISSDKPAAMPVVIEVTAALSTRSSTYIRADNHSSKDRHKLSSTSPRNVPKKVSSPQQRSPFQTVTASPNSETAQTPISSRSAAEIPSSYEYSIVRSQVRLAHNFRLVWLDSNAMKSNVDFGQSIIKLQQIFDTINTFTNSKECIDFLEQTPDETIFLLVSNELGRSIIPHIHDMSQLNSIFVFCEKKPKHGRWTKKWEKVKGIFTDINPIFEMLEQETQWGRRDSIAISITSVDLNHLDPSFMFTKLLKEILLEMNDDDIAKKELIQFCREYYSNSPHVLKIIDEFEQDYDMHTPIWWCTRCGFLYEMVNHALRSQKTSVIIKMRLFIRDLQKQIEILHEQPTEKVTLYRGQGLSYVDFDQLRTKQGDLFSFNSFLSVTIDRNVAVFYAEDSRENSELVGILFQITVEPTALTSTRLASLGNESYYPGEKEFLFTMHTVFRVGEIKKIGSRLWQVELSLTSDDDEDLTQLTEYIRQEIQGSTGWDRLSKLLLKIGSFDKAEEVFQVLIENSTDSNAEELGQHYHMMGLAKKNEKDYDAALVCLGKAEEIYQNFPGSNYLDLVTVYNDTGLVLNYMTEYSKALEYCRKALDIQKNVLHLNNSYLIVTYDTIAEVLKNMKQYSEALQFYQIILDIQKKSIPLNFSKLAVTYRNIAEMHYKMEEYPKALKVFRKVSRIQQYCLLPNKKDTVTVYNNIGQAYEKMGEYLNAREQYEEALKNSRKSHPSDVADEAIIYNNLAYVHTNMNDYSKALEFYQKTLEILERSPDLKQPDLATTHDNIGQMYKNIGEDLKALLSYRQAINIARQSSSQDHPSLQLYQEHLEEVSRKVS